MNKDDKIAELLGRIDFIRSRKKELLDTNNPIWYREAILNTILEDDNDTRR